VSILELVQVESFVPKSSFTQSFGRKLRYRESIARSFVAKSVYGYPFTRSLIEALKTRRVCVRSVVLTKLQTLFRSPLSPGLLPSLLIVVLVIRSMRLWLNDL